MIRRYDQPPLPPRVWCKLDKKVYSVMYIDFARKLYEVTDGDKTYTYRLISFRDAILMHPIYAKDKNEKMIYELDTDGEWVVFYEISMRSYSLMSSGRDGKIYRFYVHPEFEIKGHIFMPEFKDLYNQVKGELGI